MEKPAEKTSLLVARISSDLDTIEPILGQPGIESSPLVATLLEDIKRLDEISGGPEGYYFDDLSWEARNKIDDVLSQFDETSMSADLWHLRGRLYWEIDYGDLWDAAEYLQKAVKLGCGAARISFADFDLANTAEDPTGSEVLSDLVSASESGCNAADILRRLDNILEWMVDDGNATYEEAEDDFTSAYQVANKLQSNEDCWVFAFKFARFYEHGTSRIIDYGLAKSWYQKAVDHGLKGAEAYVDRAVLKLSMLARLKRVRTRYAGIFTAEEYALFHDAASDRLTGSMKAKLTDLGDMPEPGIFRSIANGSSCAIYPNAYEHVCKILTEFIQTLTGFEATAWIKTQIEDDATFSHFRINRKKV